MLVLRRRQELRSGMRAKSFWQADTGLVETVFNRTQLRDFVYSSYTAMLRGQIKDPPPRRIVLRIAEYLDCDMVERDDLLIAAGYLTRPLYLEGPDRDGLIGICSRLAELCSAPAVVVTRDWDIFGINSEMATLLGIQQETWATQIVNQNLMDLLIHPDSPGFRLVASAGHEAFVFAMRLAIGTFKRDNALCEGESWYVERLKRWRSLPEPVNPAFSELWNEIRQDTRGSAGIDAKPNKWFTMKIVMPNGHPMSIRPISLMLPAFSFPRVVAFFPADASE